MRKLWLVPYLLCLVFSLALSFGMPGLVQLSAPPRVGARRQDEATDRQCRCPPFLSALAQFAGAVRFLGAFRIGWHRALAGGALRRFRRPHRSDCFGLPDRSGQRRLRIDQTGQARSSLRGISSDAGPKSSWKCMPSRISALRSSCRPVSAADSRPRSRCWTMKLCRRASAVSATTG